MRSAFSVLLLCFLLASCSERKRLQKKAEAGDAEAQVTLGWMYYAGEDYAGKEVPKDFVESAKWYRRAAEQGNAEAQSALGELYFRGIGV